MLFKRHSGKHSFYTKIICAVSAAALTLSSMPAEAAQISLVPTDPPVSGAHLIPGTDFFWGQTDSGFCLYDSAGRPLPCGEVAGWMQGGCALLPVAVENGGIVMGVAGKSPCHPRDTMNEN